MKQPIIASCIRRCLTGTVGLMVGCLDARTLTDKSTRDRKSFLGRVCDKQNRRSRFCTCILYDHLNLALINQCGVRGSAVHKVRHVLHVND